MGVVGLLDYVPDRYTGFRQIELCEREIRFPVKQVVADRNGRIAAHLKFSCTRLVDPSLTVPHLRRTMKKVEEFLPKCLLVCTSCVSSFFGKTVQEADGGAD